MPSHAALDCLTIGYYEPKFDDYEKMMRRFGEDSEAYRDLKFSFVQAAGRNLNYAELLSHAYRQAAGIDRPDAADEFKSGDIPSLAAVYLTNYLRRHGLRADYINLFLYEQDKLRECLAARPLCVAITTTFYGLNFPVIEIIRGIREHDERVKIVVGGPLVANHHRRYPPDELLVALDDMGADAYVIESQGEQTLLRIVQCLQAGGDLSLVPNLVYRGADGKLERSAEERENNSLDENFIDWRRFTGLGATLQTRTARSCAFSCAFCAYPTRAGKLTLAGLGTIEQELDAMREAGGVKNAVFIDDTFNVPLPRFKEICRLMIRKRYGLNWFSYFRCSNSDEEAIDLMAASGCRGVFLGVESGSPAILRNMDKHAAVPQYLQGIRLLRERGILTFGSFITGFPGESATTVRETIDFIKESKLDYYRSQIWYCEPGTPIFSRKEQYGIEGEGFSWEHQTMDSLEAMDHIDRTFLEITGTRWLPQWSFDFWIIPYLLGKGLTLDRFGDFMTHANRMLALEIAAVGEREKRRIGDESMRGMVAALGGWHPEG